MASGSSSDDSGHRDGAVRREYMHSSFAFALPLRHRAAEVGGREGHRYRATRIHISFTGSHTPPAQDEKVRLAHFPAFQTLGPTEMRACPYSPTYMHTPTYEDCGTRWGS